MSVDPGALRELDAVERRRLPRLARGAGLEIDDLAPLGWDLAGARWWEEPGLRVSVGGGARPNTFLLDRGERFENDWVREIWTVAPRGQTRAALGAFADFLRSRRARVLRLRVEAPMGRAAERFWEGCGAWVVGSAGQGDFAILELTGEPSVRCRTPGGFSLGRVRPSEVEELAAWCRDPGVYGPLGFGQPPTTLGIHGFLFPADPGEAAFADVEILTARERGRPIGFCIEHGWDGAGDSVREITLTLAGRARPSPRAIRELTPAIMDACFRRGATRTLANVRDGASGGGFPRLFAWVGGEDVTAAVRAYGGGQAGRRYFASTRASFYASAAARRWADVAPELSPEGDST